MGDPILRKFAEPFKLEEINTPSTKKILNDMKSTMIHSKGLGIAAPQVGISKQLFLLEISESLPNITPVPLVAIFNPKIEFILKHETILMWESCLSVPSLVGKVPRYNNVIVNYIVPKKIIHINFYFIIG